MIHSSQHSYTHVETDPHPGSSTSSTPHVPHTSPSLPPLKSLLSMENDSNPGSRKLHMPDLSKPVIPSMKTSLSSDINFLISQCTFLLKSNIIIIRERTEILKSLKSSLDSIIREIDQEDIKIEQNFLKITQQTSDQNPSEDTSSEVERILKSLKYVRVREKRNILVKCRDDARKEYCEKNDELLKKSYPIMKEIRNISQLNGLRNRYIRDLRSLAEKKTLYELEIKDLLRIASLNTNKNSQDYLSKLEKTNLLESKTIVILENEISTLSDLILGLKKNIPLKKDLTLKLENLFSFYFEDIQLKKREYQLFSDLVNAQKNKK